MLEGTKTKGRDEIEGEEPEEYATLRDEMNRVLSHQRAEGRRIEVLEAEVALLRRAMYAGASNGFAGRCASCDEGALVHAEDALWCTSCGYRRYL
ncbi:hypothetical protein [Halegenticoccus tardaugens]|uniref:hypothetical protein n=1 Tax=Halegenticoccus tardaugens TaxID=2071624 RepID=UPI00100A7376|nr:hypothetical protein [Halegenticoccus tardaugens]